MELYSLCCSFFFQAEDGIRDYKVTGVQTCALPILIARELDGTMPPAAPDQVRILDELAGVPPPKNVRTTMPRSEERRVGKECESRGAAYGEKTKKRRG